MERMPLELVGVNHRTAPIEWRERLAVPAASLREFLDTFRHQSGAAELCLLSTCNRVEVYCAWDGNGSGIAMETWNRMMADRSRIPREEIQKGSYRYEEADAARHLFRVAAGLDAMVLGETEILGQVKEAYGAAQTAGHTGRVLNPLFQRALRSAKRVHTRTGLGRGRVSVASVAVAFARKIFGDLGDREVLVVGTGEVGEEVLEQLKRAGVVRIGVANRTTARAQELALRVGGAVFELDRLAGALTAFDVVLVCSGASEWVVTAEAAFGAMGRRGGRPLLFVDLAVPRNVDPAVERLENVFLYNLDDLQQVVGESIRQRQEEAARAEQIIRGEVDRWLGKVSIPS
jgi:glutamyl-tRNA reductase